MFRTYQLNKQGVLDLADAFQAQGAGQANVTTALDPSVSDIHLADGDEAIIRIMKDVAIGYDRIASLARDKIPGIMLMGPTGAGKSTIASAIVGEPLTVERVRGVYKINGPNTGQAYDAETVIPNRGTIGGKAIAIWDCPGFRNPDPMKEVEDAFYIKALEEMNGKLKFALVVNYNSFEIERGGDFLENVKQFCGQFQNIADVRDNVLLIVNKVPNMSVLEDVEDIIRSILDREAAIDPAVREMAEILNAKKPILFYQAPAQEGELPNHFGEDEVFDLDKLPELIVNKGIFYPNPKKICKVYLRDTQHNIVKKLFDESVEKLSKILELSKACVVNPGTEEATLNPQYSELETLLPKVRLGEGDDAKEEIHVTYNKAIFRKYPGRGELSYLQKHKKLLAESRKQIDKFTDAENGFAKLDALADFAENLFKVYEAYGSEDMKEKIIHFAYFASQMKDYAETFAKILNGKRLEDAEEGVKIFNADAEIDSSITDHRMEILIRESSEKIEEIFKNMVTGMKIAQDKRETKYYQEAIKILSPYEDAEAICKKKIAICYKKIGDIKDKIWKPEATNIAMKAYLMALKKDPTLKDAYKKLGDIYASKDMYKEAIKFYEVIRDYDSIKSCYKILFEQNPIDYTLWKDYADSLAARGFFFRAKKYYERAANRCDDESDIVELRILELDCDDSTRIRTYKEQMRSDIRADRYYKFLSQEELDEVIASFELTSEGESLEAKLENNLESLLPYLPREDGEQREERHPSYTSSAPSTYEEARAQTDAERQDEDLSRHDDISPTKSFHEIVRGLNSVADCHLPIHNESHIVTSDELVTLADYMTTNSRNVNFVTLDANNLENMRDFLMENVDPGMVRVAAINISADGQPNGPGQGSHWVTYVEYRDEATKQVSIKVLNSQAGGEFSEAIVRIDGIIRFYSGDAGFDNIDLSYRDYDFQTDLKPSCGIWSIEFLDKIIEYMKDDSHNSEGLFTMLTNLDYPNPTNYISYVRAELDLYMQFIQGRFEGELAYLPADEVLPANLQHSIETLNEYVEVGHVGLAGADAVDQDMITLD